MAWLFLLILALVSSAGVWFDLSNLVGRSTYSFLFGGMGILANLVPIIFVFLHLDYSSQLMIQLILVGFLSEHF